MTQSIVLVAKPVDGLPFTYHLFYVQETDGVPTQYVSATLPIGTDDFQKIMGLPEPVTLSEGDGAYSFLGSDGTTNFNFPTTDPGSGDFSLNTSVFNGWNQQTVYTGTDAAVNTMWGNLISNYQTLATQNIPYYAGWLRRGCDQRSRV